MLKINQEVLESKLANISVEEIAKQSGFQPKKPTKAMGYQILLGFFLQFMQEKFSLRCWAMKISLLLGDTFSKQALHKRITPAHIEFAKQLLTQALATKFDQLQSKDSPIFTAFNRVLLHDSTSVGLPDALVNTFPGSRSKGVRKAVAKVQQVYDLLSHRCIYFKLTPYSINDQKASSFVLPLLKAGDLLIRDLGYFALDVLQKVIYNQAFFLTRLHHRVKLFHPDGQLIDLPEQLEGKSSLDTSCLVGQQFHLPTRMVAIRVPQQVATERRREAKKQRDGRFKVTKRYLQLLDYNILLTNVPTETWTTQQVASAYGFRWRIEITFKAWKTHLHLQKHLRQQLMQTTTVKLLIYYTLLFIVLFVMPIYNYFSRISKKPLSLLRVVEFIKEHWMLILHTQPQQWEKPIIYYCSYEKRNKRVNQMQQIFSYPQS